MASQSGLVVVRRYPHWIHAELAKTALETYGVTEVVIAGPYGEPHDATAVELLVKAIDAEQAREILGPDEQFSE